MLDQVKDDFQLVASTYHNSAELKLVLNNPVIKSSEKKKAVNSIFGDKLSTLSLQFLQLVIEKKRETVLMDICRNFNDQYKIYKGIKTAVLTTVVPVDSATRTNLVSWIGKKFNAQIELIEEINPSLKGGFVLRVEDIQLDMSVSSRLNEVKKQLLSTDFVKKF